MDKIESATSAKRSLARLADVLGAVPEPARPSSFEDFLRRISIDARRDVSDGLGTLGGAAAGSLLWREHRFLGLIGGASLGRNLPAMLRPQDRAAAFSNMAVTGTAVFSSLCLPRYPKLGFVLGWLIGGLAAGSFR